MLAILLIRIVVCFLLFVAVALNLAWILLFSTRIAIQLIEWNTWAGFVAQILLLGFYCHSARKHEQVSTWKRVAFVVVFSDFVIYAASDDIFKYDDYILGSNASFYDCNYVRASGRDDPCYVNRSWTTIVIVATCITTIEALYILRKGSMDHSQSAAKPNVIVVSSLHHPYGIQPNMTVPYGEPQPQHLVYQQPMYPQLHPQPFHHPYPAMQPAGGGAAMPLQHIPQHQTSFKYEDPSQSHYPYPQPSHSIATKALPQLPESDVTSVP